MKKLIGILGIALLFSACEIVYVEPQVDPRDYITGSYTMVEYSDTYGTEISFPVRISKVSNDWETIRIHNFYDVGINVRAYYRNGQITIPFQVVDMYEVRGGGVIQGREIDFDYSVFDQYLGGYTDYCLATAY